MRPVSRFDHELPRSWSPVNTVRWGVNDLHRSGMMDALTRRCATGQLDDQWLMIRSGIVSIIFGILLITQPGAGAIAIVWLLRAYALLFGILTLMRSFRLRGMRERQGCQASGMV